MKVTCQVVTVPSVDTAGTTILLSLETKKYLLGNVGEGIQRALLQRKIKTGRINDLFLSGKTEYRNVGGLLGLILTLADQESARGADYETRRLEAVERVRAYAEGRGGGGTAPNIPEPYDKKALNIHGNDNLIHTMGTTRSFVFRTSMTANFNEIEDDFVDELLRVHPMKIYPEGFVPNPNDTSSSTDLSGMALAGGRKRSFDGEPITQVTRGQILRSVVRDMFNSSWTMDTTMPEDEIPPHVDNPNPSAISGPPKQVRAPWPASMVNRLPRTKPSLASLSYYVTLHPHRGRFLPQVAKQLGVKPGPEFRKLTDGQSVTTDDGRIVTPEECMEPPKPGKKVLVLDIPDITYVEPLLLRDELQDDNLEGTVFWLLGSEVAKDERIWERIRKWKDATNIIASPDTCPNSISLQGAAKACTALNLLHPDNFPIPTFKDQPAMIPPEVPGPLLIARPQQHLSILPKFEKAQLPTPMTREDGSFDFEGVRAAIEPEYIKLASEARESVLQAEGEEREELPGKEVEVIPLGTGSAMPSKYRNVSSTLLRIPGVGSILFDCGEGTLGQLSRLYGPEELPKVLKDIKCIYISHLHADHHLGTTAVLRAWYESKHHSMPLKQNARGSPGVDVTMIDATQASPSPAADEDVMWIVALGKYNGMLREYADVEDFGYSRVRFIASEDIRTGEGYSLRHLHQFYKSLFLAQVETARANHCVGAATCAFTFIDGFKFAYSGDTRPTAEFVRIGKGATLLLHEATFDDELQAEAIAKKHSTTAEAIKAGMDMQAKTLMLTHFSQRYPKLPVISQEGHGKQKMKVALGFDMMRMKVGEIWRFEKFIPALRELYKDEGEEEDAVVVIAEKDVQSSTGGNKQEKRKGKQPKQGRQARQGKQNGKQVNSLTEEGSSSQPLPEIGSSF